MSGSLGHICAQALALHAVVAVLGVGERTWAGLSARWLWSLAIGSLAAAFLIANVMGDDSTARPSGLEFAWAIA